MIMFHLNSYNNNDVHSNPVINLTTGGRYSLYFNDFSIVIRLIKQFESMRLIACINNYVWKGILLVLLMIKYRFKNLWYNIQHKMSFVNYRGVSNIALNRNYFVKTFLLGFRFISKDVSKCVYHPIHHALGEIHTSCLRRHIYRRTL